MTSPGHERQQQVLRVILIEGMANLLVLGAKIIVGLSTGSLAILADAIHSLTDLANNFVAWFVIRISAMPADREHPYGHKKFETLAVFVLALVLSLMAIELTFAALRRDAPQITSRGWEVVMMLAILIINVSVAAWQRMWARRLKSSILYADASHTFADVMVTIGVIVGWQLSAAGYAWLDQVCTLGVALVVLYLAYGLFRRALPALVDQYAIDPDLLTAAIQQVEGVRHVSQVRSRWIGDERAIDMIVGVDPLISTEQSHHIADRIEKQIASEFNVTDVSIHVEPCRDND